MKVRSELQGFRLIDRISRAGKEEIRGVCTLAGGPLFTLIEALAQLGALHVRYLTGFTRHAFLLKIARCTLPGGVPAAGVCPPQGKADRAERDDLRLSPGGREGGGPPHGGGVPVHDDRLRRSLRPGGARPSL